MDSLTLLRAAAALGLRVHAEGERLVARGPKSASDLARHVLAHKPEVMTVLGNPALAREWLPDAARVFRDHLDANRRRGLTVAPGTEGWEGAVRAARRAAAGIPNTVIASEPGIIDHLLEAFEATGGLRCTAVRPRMPWPGDNPAVRPGPGDDGYRVIRGFSVSGSLESCARPCGVEK